MTPRVLKKDESMFPPFKLYSDDVRNLALLTHNISDGKKATAMRFALRLSVYYLGLRSARELDFYPPKFTPKEDAPVSV